MSIFTHKHPAGPSRLKPVAQAEPETPWTELWQGFCRIVRPHAEIRDAVVAYSRQMRAQVISAYE